ncbi:DUF1661 domain-containing protein [Porphyromonas gulae]|uniref:DUF1661 domain-containing protein n=1 Tax=Porphyromonas gulae TaxID=111105 RepID=UPI0026EA159A|nr:DUF1661 domain-containing protein [Porphyromonas gulae]
MWQQKTWREKIFVVARKFFASRATTKKFLRHFYRKHAPQSEHFWFTIFRPKEVVPTVWSSPLVEKSLCPIVQPDSSLLAIPARNTLFSLLSLSEA